MESTDLTISARVDRPVPAGRDAGQLAGCFGLTNCTEVLYDDCRLSISPGQIVLLAGPSGAGKSVFLSHAARQIPHAIGLDVAGLATVGKPALRCLPHMRLRQRLELLSRCGLAEPAALITPANRLSGGQLHRLALARAVCGSLRQSARPAVVIADEFTSCLDRLTAWSLARQVRKLATRYSVTFILAGPNDWLAHELRPDWLVVKPLAQPARVVGPNGVGDMLAAESRAQAHRRIDPPDTWPIRRGSLADYRQLAPYHYLAGPPAANHRVWAIDAPPALRTFGGPVVAAVCVVSPPTPNGRGRNAAFGDRYAVADKRLALRRLNAEIECISRVVVHPACRSLGLAVRLVRHAISSAKRPIVEALAAMGVLHPLFERAGMTPVHLQPTPAAARLASAAEVVGLGPDGLSAPAIRRWLARAEPSPARFFRAELDRFARKALGPRALARLAEPLPAICRKAAAGYVYYYHAQ